MIGLIVIGGLVVGALALLVLYSLIYSFINHFARTDSLQQQIDNLTDRLDKVQKINLYSPKYQRELRKQLKGIQIKCNRKDK